MTKKLKFVDLFAGAGGLSCGLEQAGLECVLGVDFDKAAMKTFKKNHKHAEVFVGDIGQLDGKTALNLIKNKKVDLVCGGPPCQGLSTVGKGIPDDPRNFLFLQFVRLVKTFDPKYIILENVTGMVGKKNEKILNGILNEFKKLGYEMDVHVLSAHHYGVPQKRRRTIFIGNKAGYQNIFPPIMYDAGHEDLPPTRTVGNAIEEIISSDGEIYNHNVEKAQLKNEIDVKRIAHVPEGKSIRYEKDETTYLPKELRFGIDWATVDERRFRQAKYRRLSRDEPSPTIMTDGHSYYHPIENRLLTPREAAAIQSFPNDFIFEGTYTQQWRQIGNAVPPLLGKALGEAILKIDKEKPKSVGSKRSISEIRSGAFIYKKVEKLDKKQQKLTAFSNHG
ncbi:MAG TPA: DNA cytosine methyltransferase [archaeon]|nr:DNA cytosine methyltransferase [archaeon]